MSIVRNFNRTDLDKIRDLCDLCRDTGQTVYAITKTGVLEFPEDGKDVTIRHANPARPTAESKLTYSFETVGGVSYAGLRQKKVEMDLEAVNAFETQYTKANKDILCNLLNM